MSTTTWPAGYEKTLRAYLPLLAADQAITPDLDLRDAGLDSLATVSLLLELEEVFAIMVPDDDLTNETFQTAGSLWRVIERLLASGGG